MVKERCAKAIFDCTGDDEHELTFKEGDIILNVEETAEEGWLRGTIERTGEQGLFPDNYVEFFEVEKSTVASSARPAVVMPVTASPATKPTLPGRKVAAPGTLGGAGRVALPQLADETKATPSPALPSRPSETAASGGPPPSLPQRNNTIKSGVAGEDATPTPASIRERMANLSATAALNQQHTPAGSGVGLHAGSAKPSNPGRFGTPVLPARSNAALPAKESPASSTVTKPNGTPSPLSSAARPALPPRTSTGGSSGTNGVKLPTSSLASSSPPRSFQVASAEAPAPKLTTFSRPRSARSTKATSSPSSPAEGKPNLSASPKSISSVASAPPSTTQGSLGGAPKLPARSATSTSLSAASTAATSSKVPSSSSGSTGPIRFAAMRQDSERNTEERGDGNIGRSSSVAVAALPAISRNAQPLPLPSRPSTTSAAESTIAPPLPARSNTIGVVDEAARTLGGGGTTVSDVAAAVPERSGSSRQTPGFKYQPVASQQYLKHGASQTNVASSAVQNETATSSMPGAFQVGRPTIYKGGQRLNGSSSSIGSSLTAANSGTSKAAWAPKSLGATDRSLSIGGGSGAGSTAAGRPTPSPPPAHVVTIRPDALKRYEALFESKVGNNAFMDAVQVYAIYVRSRLDSKTLAQIWDLVDVSSRGALTKAQFCMGLYLIDERLSSGVIPLEISPELWSSASAR